LDRQRIAAEFNHAAAMGDVLIVKWCDLENFVGSFGHQLIPEIGDTFALRVTALDFVPLLSLSPERFPEACGFSCSFGGAETLCPLSRVFG
jgi:hypothetical protein